MYCGVRHPFSRFNFNYCGDFFMGWNRYASIVIFFIGILFFACPLFFRNSTSLIMSLALICFGVSTIFKGNIMKKLSEKNFSNFTILMGILVAAVGLSSFFHIGMELWLEFYMVGAIFFILAMVGFLSNMNRIYDLCSIVLLMASFTTFFLIINDLGDLTFLAIIVGIVLIADGFALFISD